MNPLIVVWVLICLTVLRVFGVIFSFLEKKNSGDFDLLTNRNRMQSEIERKQAMGLIQGPQK